MKKQAFEVPVGTASQTAVSAGKVSQVVGSTTRLVVDEIPSNEPAAKSIIDLLAEANSKFESFGDSTPQHLVQYRHKTTGEIITDLVEAFKQGKVFADYVEETVYINPKEQLLRRIFGESEPSLKTVETFQKTCNSLIEAKAKALDGARTRVNTAKTPEKKEEAKAKAEKVFAAWGEVYEYKARAKKAKESAPTV